MKSLSRNSAIIVLLGFVSLAARGALAAEDEAADRAGFWIDLYFGEPIAYEEMLEDLAGSQVIYLGERHRLERHHEIQAGIITALANQGVPLVLGLEQLETYQQPILDRYNRGQIDFDKLAELTDWGNRWHGYEQYRPVVEAAHKAGAPVLALNARSETIRKIARSGGLTKLDAQTRKELPKEIQTDDPPYEKLLSIFMRVHVAATAERLRPMLEAQIARDESMAAALCRFLESKQGKGRTAVVVCGSGHVNYSLGTAARVRRRIPEIKDRVILLSGSGDVVLAPSERAMARKIRITHDQMRAINLPVADYLHATELKKGDRRAFLGDD